MIKIKVLALFFLLPVAGFAQTSFDDDNPIEKEFSADTARVEQRIRKMLDSDYSTMGMIDASVELEAEYDVLLNKYYKKLLNELTSKERTALKVTQQNWIKYRDSEKGLISTLEGNTYRRMGGGTMWGVVAASDRAQLTKKRVIELYNYLINYSF